MSLRTTIHEVLGTSAAVTAILGAGDSLRHYPVRAPQGTVLPYLVSQMIASQAQQTHGRPTDGEDTLDETLVQFTAVAEDPDSAAALLAAVRAAFMDPAAQPACRALLDTAHITATAPELRDGTIDEIEGLAPQLDITFFHNPST